jgi:peptidoglycan-associated lipoprotein
MKKIHYILHLFFVIGLLNCSLSCNYTLKIKDGKTAFERKQFSVATGLLQKDYAKAKTRTEKGKIAFLIAESYRILNTPQSAATWYKSAYENGVGADALKELAYTYKKQELYPEAAENFKNLGLEIGSPYEYKREIAACTTAKTWLSETAYSGYTVQNVEFNSASADYAPMGFEAEKLIFSSDRAASTGDAVYAWSGNKFSDLFLIENNIVKNFTDQINTPANEASASLSSDNSELYFVRSGGEGKDVEFQYPKIYFSKKIGSNWTTPEVLPFCKDKVEYGTPAISGDGRFLFFSANDPEGWGGRDIYICEKTSEGFVEPRLMSRMVNTQGNEAYPFVQADTLYFASDYHPGMGGYDIFKTHRGSDGNWTTPQNLKAPINSGADDLGFMVSTSKTDFPEGVFQRGYFTSNRVGGRGNDDIYKFERRVPIAKPIPPQVDTPKTSVPTVLVYKNVLDIVILEKVYQIADNPNSKVLGRKPLTNAKITVALNGKKTEVNVDAEGMVHLDLAKNSDYSFLAAADGFLNNNAKFSSKGISEDPSNPNQKFELEIVLDRIFKDKEITLENIYYDYNKWNIRTDAQPTLNRLAETLIQNPNVRIQLASHTDCRGKDDYNASLSQKRAESAVAYLIKRGLDPSRLTAKGYGETAPAVSCDCNKCAEDEHQANRRTTFKILE